MHACKPISASKSARAQPPHAPRLLSGRHGLYQAQSGLTHYLQSIWRPNALMPL